MRDPRERFVALAEARTDKAIKIIRLIGNLSDQRNYEFHDDDVRKIFAALEKETKLARARFSEQSEKSKTTFRLS